jgi:competence protein ComEA
MQAAQSPVGVATASAAPAWADKSRWPAPPSIPALALPSAGPPVWTRPTQAATALLLTLALGLLGWHAYRSQRTACRPTVLDTVGRVDLNRADRAQLMQLPGVGEALARRIEEYRLQHGGFRSVDELRRVHGIGPAILERLRPLVGVEPPQPEETAPPAPLEAGPVPRSGRKEVAAGGDRVDVNNASAAQLQTLPGIGPKLSQRIVDAREQRPFRSVEDLRRVRGIGVKTLERLRPHVTVGEPAR